MPRIDPGRLLKCLNPLLEPSSGAIKSEKEVDKIYGLMSKFSKKLVSKATYLNILKATPAPTLDLFLGRGGWAMLNSWTVEAISSSNLALLTELASLFLIAPANIDRLKENDLPKTIKKVSRESEHEEIRAITKRVVLKWIAIAKQEDSELRKNPSLYNSLEIQGSSVSIPGCDAQPDSEVNIKLPAAMDNEHHQPDFDTTTFDISNTDLNEYSDFNPEDFSQTMNNFDQHLAELPSESDSSEPVKQNNSVLHPESELLPKITIRTIAGHSAVVRGLAPYSSDGSPYCLVTKGGKHFLMKLKLADHPPLVKIEEAPKNPSEKCGTTAPLEKKRRPRKDPSITASSKGGSSTETVRTYGSQKNASVSPSSRSSELDVKDACKVGAPAIETKKSDISSATKKTKSASGSKSGSVAAAAAAKLAADEEKLKEKIKKQKTLMKQRHKEAKKQQQQEKDQETLKKLNLAKLAPSASMKIPKIPKKTSSFSDAIGIPGCTTDVTISVSDKPGSSQKDEIFESVNLGADQLDSSIPSSKFYGKKADIESPKQRRQNRVKVFNSKSRSADLIKDMTENIKSKSKPEMAKEVEPKPVNEKPTSSNSNCKPIKRSSLDEISKPGENKKPKLSEEKIEKDKSKKEEKEKVKPKEKLKAVGVIKESSIFMDFLNASTETQKPTKKKRRLSSSGADKDICPLSKPGKGKSSPTPDIEEVKPTFNFYRDTLSDTNEETVKQSEVTVEIAGPTDLDANIVADEAEAFVPGENEGKLKSALIIHRPKEKKRKSVRWREEDYLKEFHYFEMDENERVNVTKFSQVKQEKDFSAQFKHEKAEEKLTFRRKLIGDPMEERIEWKLLRTVQLGDDIPRPCVNSMEREVQENRENTVLGIFLPPGSILPDSPAEPDPSETISIERNEPRIMTIEDVTGVTKVYDNRNDLWPAPTQSNSPHDNDPNIFATNYPTQNVGVQIPNPAVGFSDYNPWSNPFGVPVMTMPQDVWNVTGVEGQFPPYGNPSMNMMGSAPPNVPFPINQFPGFEIPAGPPTMSMPTDSFPNFNDVTREQSFHGGHQNNRGRGGGRDFERDNRGNRGSRDRDRNTHRDRDHRDYRDDRERDRGRDYYTDRSRNDHRDHRRERDREKDHEKERDYHDRSRSKGKREIPCRYFKKGYCQNGNHCDFVHSGHHGLGGSSSQYKTSGPGTASGKIIDNSSNRSTRTGSPSLLTAEDNIKLSSNNSALSSSASISSIAQRNPIPEDEGTRFFLPPSSPPNELCFSDSLFPPGTENEPAKLIPIDLTDD